MNPFQHIYQRYVDEASFLWVLRDIALNQPHYSSDDLNDLEERIRRQLNGIMTAPEDAWLACEEALVIGEAGEVFTAAVTAFRCGHVEKIQSAVETAVKNEGALKGLCSALDFLPGNLCHDWIKKFFTSKNLVHKRVALEACLLRGENPATYLNKIIAREDCRADVQLFSACLRSVGQFKRAELISFVTSAVLIDEEEIRFYALRSQILLGNHALVSELELFVFNEGQFQSNAIEIVFRLLPIVEARTWISKLVAKGTMTRAAIKAVATLGDPQAVSWLLGLLEKTEVTKIAADAFATITGLNLQDEGFTLDEPESDEEPNDDEFVALDEDEYLVYPNVEAMRRWWQQHGNRFVVGQRYFTGRVIEDAVLREQISTGYQRRRHQAALELALRQLSVPLINTYSFKSSGK